MGNFRSNQPLGTTDVKVLLGNSSHFDVVANSKEEESTPDRFGRRRKTLWGMECDFQRFLVNSGYQDMGDYAVGIELTARNQMFYKDGELYRASVALDLPYTLTGDWALEAGFFVAMGDQVLRQQLADSSSPNSGPGMIGFDEGTEYKDGSVGAELNSLKKPLVRTRPKTQVKDFRDYFNTTEISIFEYADLADKTMGSDPQYWDWTQAIQAAVDAIRAAFIDSLQLYGPLVLIFPAGIYKVSAKITVSPFVKLKSAGFVFFKTNVPGDSAFHFTHQIGDPTSTIELGKQQWFRGSFLNGLDGGFFFKNDAGMDDPRTTAIELGPRSDLGDLLPWSRFSSNDVAVQEYGTALKLNRFRNYIGFFDRWHIEGNETSVRFGDQHGENAVDSGENITFSDSIIAGCTTAFLWHCDGFDLNLNNCSVDFVGLIFWLQRGYKKITVLGGHIEAIGSDFRTQNIDGKGGILLYDSQNAISDQGATATLFINGTSMLDSAPKSTSRRLIRNSAGRPLYININWDYRRVRQSSSSSNDIFLVDGDRVYGDMDVRSCQTGPLFMHESKNLVYDYGLENAANWSIDKSGGVLHSITNSTEIGGNIFRVEAANASSYFTARSGFIDVEQLKDIFCTFRFFKQTSGAPVNPQIRCTFYDETKAELVDKQIAFRDIGGVVDILNKWVWPDTIAKFTAPRRARYFRIAAILSGMEAGKIVYITAPIAQ